MDKRKQRVTKWLTWLVITAQIVALFSTATVTVFQPTPAWVQEVGQQANLANRPWQWVVDTAAQGASMVQSIFGAPKVALAETGSFQVSASGQNFSCAINSSNGVQCWGNNASGQLGNGTNTQSLIPVQVTGLTGGVIDIAAGSLFACALTSSGSVKCWGENGNGQLGNKDATLADSNTPVDVYSLSTGVVALDGGAGHMCALLATGGVKCWGDNSGGQIGDGAYGDNLWPVHVLGLQSGVAAISAGYNHSCAVLTDGTAECWGSDAKGQLGNTAGNSAIPVPVVVDSAGVPVSGIMAISAGQEQTCALLTTGGLKCWGWNNYGQLGNGNTTNQSYPVNVSGITSGAATVSAGDQFTCAVLADGSAKCWGLNWSSQLGNGASGGLTANSTPVAVSGLSSGVASISTAVDGVDYGASYPGLQAHACVAMVAGGVKCWGFNGTGQVGNNSTTNAASQVNVTGFTGLAVTTPIVKFVPVGGFNYGPQNLNVASAARTATLYNASGASASISAISITGTDANQFAISGGTCGSTFPVTVAAGSTCTLQLTFTPTSLGGKTAKVAVTSNAPAVSIPLSGVGVTVGTGAPTITSNGGLATANVSVFENGVYVTAVTAQGASPITFSLFGGADQARFTIDATGNLRFINSPNFEAPADSNTDNVYEVTVLVQNNDDAVTQDIAVKVQDAPDTFSSVIGAGAEFSCAIVSGGAVKCWGDNTSGQLGDGTNTQRNLPTAVTGLTGIKAIAVGSLFACALSNAGGVQCWGENGSGQLGIGTLVDSNTPVQVQGLTSGVAAIDAGSAHVCILTTGGAMQCWGENGSGQLGAGGSGDVTTPSAVTGLTSGIIAMSAGDTHSCAVLSDSTARCWGADTNGALGNVAGNSSTPVPVVVDANGVLVTGFRTISAGAGHTCASMTTGGVKCWGWNNYGQLGDTTSTNRSYPVDVPALPGAVDPGGVGVAALSAGDQYTCAALNDGTAKCWGLDWSSQLGTGSSGGLTVNSTPLPVTGLSSGVVAINAPANGVDYSASYPGLQSHTCAATTDGAVKCWGFGTSGQLGYGGIVNKAYPVMAGDAGNPASAPTTPVAGFSPASGSTIAFGSQAVGSPSAPQTVTINNSGASPLTLNSASVTGSNYAISGGTCGATFPVIVNAGANCTLQITFTPISAGSKISTLSVSSDSGGQTTTNTISLTGTGVTGPTATPTPNLTATADAQATANAAATATAAVNATATAAAQATANAAATATAIAQATANAAATATAVAGGPTATPTATPTPVTSGGPDLTVTIGQPSPSFAAGAASNVPVTVANVGGGATTASISVSVTLPTGTSAPASFTSGLWSCTTTGQTVTCTQAGPIAAGASSIIQLPVTPSAGVVGTTPGPFNGSATTAGETNTGNNGATPMTPTTPVAPAAANNGSLKVILGGAYDPTTGFMRDNLRSLAAFPSTSPYGDGATLSSRSVLTANNIVDWVLVELRDATTPATVSASKGALLQRDGDVVGTDGVSNLTFTGLTASSYYVAIKHRNHLGAMTIGTVTVNAGMVSVDFTAMVATYGSNGQRYYNNKYMLWPGDANADRKIIMAGPNNDTNGILSAVLGDVSNTAGNANFIVRGYSVGDVNLDGKVLASGPNNDRSVIASTVFVYPINSSGSANYIINQQMP